MGDELLKNVPPHNLEAERAVLGALLLDHRAIDHVVQEIAAEDFYRPVHTTIYQTMLELNKRGDPIDAVLLATELRQRNQLETVGGPKEIADLTTVVPTSANAVYYAKIVRDKALLRKTLNSLAQSQQEIFESGGKTEELLDRIEKRLFDVTQKRVKSEAIDIATVLKETFRQLEARKTGTDDAIKYGYPSLDDLTHGLHKGDMVIIAARPSMGKCVAGDTEIVLEDGRVATIEEIVERREARLLTLGEDRRLRVAQPSAFVDDGEKPVFRVTTRLGRSVETTAVHPFLTLEGWCPLSELAVGDEIALPREIPVFGDRALRPCEVKLLAYLIGDGGLTQTCPIFTNGDRQLSDDFRAAVADFGGVHARLVHDVSHRTASWRVSSDPLALTQGRKDLAGRLRARMAALGLTSRAVAQGAAVTPASVTHWTQGKTVPEATTFALLCRTLSVSERDLAPEGHAALLKNGKNALTRWLEALGLWGRSAAEKHVPSCIFTLPRTQLALFLNRLFATDGWVTILDVEGRSQVQAGYATVSERLARQVQHLLLRFGIVAKLRKRSVRYRDTRRPAFQLDVTDARSLLRLLDEIGVFGKEEACSRAREVLARQRHRALADAIPAGVWETVGAVKGSEPWASLGRRAGVAGASNLHRDERVSRERLGKIAAALGDERLEALATSDVLWDPITSIEPVGDKHVYDLTIPETHNFVANDVCVHNTTFALNLLRNVAVGRPGAPAGHGAVFFSLEMPKTQIVANLLCSMAKVDSHRLRGGFLSRQEEQSLLDCAEVLEKQPIHIDDTPGISVMELRGKARRLKAEGKIECVLIDYLQLMQGDMGSSQKARHEVVAEISRSLKALARELEVPVIALAQLNRNVEDRPDHRPRMADLRESGSIEQDADVVMLLHRDEYYMQREKAEAENKLNKAQVLVQKNRNGPIGDVELYYAKEFSYFGELQR